jgi:hypothetical protein
MTPDRFNSGRTRNERRASRAANLDHKAGRLLTESEAADRQAKRYLPDPPDQPILVGHHSEKRHRNALRKAHAATDKSIKLWREAKETERRARAAAANFAIRSTDADATELLTAKKALLETEREWMKTVNVVWRSHSRPKARDTEGWQAVAAAMDEQLASFDQVRGRMAASWMDDPQPYPAWELQNLSANIRRVTARVEEVEKVQSTGARPERSIGTAIVRDNPDYDTVEIHFRGKPSETVLSLLRSHGFRWIRNARCWSRRGRNATTEWKLELIAKEIGAPIEAVSPEVGSDGGG